MTRRLWVAAALLALVSAGVFVRVRTVHAAPKSMLHKTRQAASDLEIGGSLNNVGDGGTRFVSYNDLLTLPQESYTVSDDANFVGAVTVSGVALAKLPELLGAGPGAAMVIAICDDSYNAHYPAAYLSEHHPLLVLRVNGQPPAQWPRGADGSALGPYMVSHPSFMPAFHVLAHEDEAQRPWGVLRLDVRNEAEVYAPIAPQSRTHDEAVQQGFAIARQNCFRCHSREGEGGTKSAVSWDVIAKKSATDAKFFDTYVRTPRKLNPKSQMAASPRYDDATLAVLRAYFTTFTETP